MLGAMAQKKKFQEFEGFYGMCDQMQASTQVWIIKKLCFVFKEGFKKNKIKLKNDKKKSNLK